MRDGKDTFDVLSSIQNHIKTLKPILPKQAIICVGEYPIKTIFNKPNGDEMEQPLSILIGNSSDEIYTWVPKVFKPNLVLGFEDANVNTHFWYDVLSFISKDEILTEALKKKPFQKLHGALLLASVWDGVGSALLPTLISKFKASNMNSLSIALLPSKVQPVDAYFNTVASLGMCMSIDGTTVVLMDRDHVESYEGVDRDGYPIKGNAVATYLINMLLAKDTLAQEVSELSRTFNIKIFTVLFASGASLRIYGSLENMLNAIMLKPLLSFNLSSSSILYVLLRMPASHKDKLPRGKIELSIASWFKEKANLKSIYIAEPIYVEDTCDRIDMALFIGGFETTQMFADFEKKVRGLRSRAVQKGLVKKNDWKAMMKSLGLKKDEETPS
jgi:hypothetical protein